METHPTLYRGRLITPEQLIAAGQRLERWRRENGRISQRVFAERAGVSVGAVQSLEAGTRATRLTSLEKIAARVGLTLEEFLTSGSALRNGIMHADPRVAQLMPDDVEIAIMYQRAPGELKIEIRDRLRAHYAGIDPRYHSAIVGGAVQGSFARKIHTHESRDKDKGE